MAVGFVVVVVVVVVHVLTGAKAKGSFIMT